MSGPDLHEFEVIAAGQSKSFAPCTVRLTLDALPAKEAVVFRAALERRDLPPGALEAWARKRDLRCTRTGVITHRDRKCQCNREGLFDEQA